MVKICAEFECDLQNIDSFRTENVLGKCDDVRPVDLLERPYCYTELWRIQKSVLEKRNWPSSLGLQNYSAKFQISALGTVFDLGATKKSALIAKTFGDFIMGVELTFLSQHTFSPHQTRSRR